MREGGCFQAHVAVVGARAFVPRDTSATEISRWPRYYAVLHKIMQVISKRRLKSVKKRGFSKRDASFVNNK